MKSRFGNVKVVYDRCGRYVVGCPRKRYVRRKPYVKPLMRIPISPRESACYIMLRRKGHRIEHIARAFGRSLSVVWRRIQKNSRFFPSIRFDMRKMPDTTRKLFKNQRWDSMLKWLPLWENWILGEGEKPP